jgi:geranylgeranyl diphosphate synthase type I
MVKIFRDFMGGKNIRGALTYGSYLLFGGRGEESILKASNIINITHAFLLMHDDVMDEDDLRRGFPTVHKQYEKIFKKKYPENAHAEHSGLSMAINIGDLGSYFSNLILTETTFDSDTKIKFLKILSETIITTAYGQAMDLIFEKDRNFTLAKVLKVHHYKSALYTINGPLKYGAILAGADENTKQFKALNLYGTPVGIAFQLRDDELGMFSNRKTLGKPVDSDLKEGKLTYLFLKAFEKGTREQVEFLRYAHGNKNITEADTKKVRDIIIETGALSDSQKLSRTLALKGKKYISQITKNRYYQNLLAVAADYMIERNN